MHMILKDIYHGKGNRSTFIYATLVHAESGQMAISGTLDYILTAVAERGYILVKE